MVKSACFQLINKKHAQGQYNQGIRGAKKPRFNNINPNKLEFPHNQQKEKLVALLKYFVCTALLTTKNQLSSNQFLTVKSNSDYC